MTDIEAMQPAGRRGLSTRRVEIEAVREWFCSRPFDQAFTAYYPMTTVDFIEGSCRYGHSPGERALNYTKERLIESGYRGYYVIAVHDKFGSTLWHPHMMLDGRYDQMKKVERAFFPVADINCKQNGPIQDLKAWGHYCATRASEYGLDSMHFEFDFMGLQKKMRKRGSRGRGGGRQITPTIEIKEMQHA